MLIRRNSIDIISHPQRKQTLVLLDPLIAKEIQNKCQYTCLLCFSEIQRSTTCKECQNIFCKDCITQWTKCNNTCPICKRGWKIDSLKNYQHNSVIISKENKSMCCYCFELFGDSSIESHISVCKALARCQFCNKEMMKRELDKHEIGRAHV